MLQAEQHLASQEERQVAPLVGSQEDHSKPKPDTKKAGGASAGTTKAGKPASVAKPGAKKVKGPAGAKKEGAKKAGAPGTSKKGAPGAKKRAGKKGALAGKKRAREAKKDAGKKGALAGKKEAPGAKKDARKKRAASGKNQLTKGGNKLDAKKLSMATSKGKKLAKSREERRAPPRRLQRLHCRL
ncbi:cylicin-2-like [Macrobrachium rosenbergii]|uniref:cylicin-2-like n=1 Tax=Macrobrachium rosenbergii TaxID=79674 RepID=UPI0034D42935